MDLQVHTAHLVIAIVLALGTSNAQRRRSLGSDRIYSLKSRMRCIFPREKLGSKIFVVADSLGEGVPNRHCRSDGDAIGLRGGILLQWMVLGLCDIMTSKWRMGTREAHKRPASLFKGEY